MKCLLSFSALILGAAAQDPSPGWLSYATYTDPQDRRITSLNTTWVVPSFPTRRDGSSGAPGWWFGVQTKDGDGALVQPILAWGYMGEEWTIFNACYDWTDESWNPSDESYTVQPGDLITSSIVYQPRDNSYDMYIASQQLGKSITTNYKLERGQTKNESQAYFVLEHQPDRCDAYPSNGVCTFENIYLEVDNEPVKAPAWKALQETPACNSKCTVKDANTIEFSWTPSAHARKNPRKWAAARP